MGIDGQQFVSSADLLIIEKSLKEAMSKEVQKATNYEWQDLQLAASTFLSGYEALEKNKEMLKKQYLLSLINIANTGDENIYPEIKRLDTKRTSDAAYVARSEEILIQKFQQNIDIFIGQKLPREGIFVIENKKTGQLKSFYIPLDEIARRVSARFKISYGTQKGRVFLEEQEEFVEGGHAEKAQMAFSAVRARAQRWREKYNANQLQGFLLMWKEGAHWSVARVSNMGAVKEGYIQALFTKHQSDIDVLCKSSTADDDGYGSHEMVKNFYYNYLGRVTNMSAILQEDLVTENKQYAIKSADSHTAHHGQYLNVAKKIISQRNPLSQDEFLNIIQAEYYKTSAQTTLIKEANSVVDKVVEETTKSLKQAVVNVKKII